MPVIPTLTSFPSGPDLAGAAAAADQLRQRQFEAVLNYQMQQDRLAQEAQADAIRIQLAREQIEARKVETEMELQAKQKMVEQEALQRQHQAQVLAEYRKAQLGLSERRADAAEEAAAWKIDQAANNMARRFQFDRLFAKYQPELGDEAAARRAGFESGLFAPVRPASGQSPFPALNFQLRQLDSEERSLMNKYPGITASMIKSEDQAALADIQRRRRELQIPPGVTNAPSATVTGTNAPPGLSMTGAATNEVIRRDKNGRRVVFDLTTKKPIRYAD